MLESKRIIHIRIGDESINTYLFCKGLIQRVLFSLLLPRTLATRYQTIFVNLLCARALLDRGNNTAFS